VKLGETEGELAAKTEALNLLQAATDKFQAEVNKLQVEKEFIGKQLATKDSKIEELEKANKELLDDMPVLLMRGSKRLWPKPRAKTQESTPPTATLATTSLMERWFPSTLGNEQHLLVLHVPCNFVFNHICSVCNSNT